MPSLPFRKRLGRFRSPTSASIIRKTGSRFIESGREDKRMNREGRTRDELFPDPDEIVAFAQAYYATEFPNSERSGCPPAESLRKIASDSTLPDARLRAHLFNCSECFRSFRSARISYRPQADAKWTWKEGLPGTLISLLTLKRAPFGAIATGIVLLTVISVFIWRATVEPTHTAMNTQPQGPIVPTMQVTTPADTAPADMDEPASSASRVGNVRREQIASLQRKHRSSMPSRTEPSLQVVEIDLQEEDLMRDADVVGSRPRLIALAPRPQRLYLQLPEGSTGGRYRVSVVDLQRQDAQGRSRLAEFNG
jgi:hypothetical protein